MSQIKSLENLLEKVSIISKKYDDIAKITGENFNIFSVLKMDRKEVKTHSAFLGELLNPRGIHGLNDVFLKLFINQTKTFLNFEFEFETNFANSFVEENIGKINDDKTEGGRIDIIIKDIKGNIIVIENKIDAIEQKNQLIRYNNAYPNAKIFFLTLTGYESKTAGKFNYFQISYKENIVFWLEACLKESVNFPMLREVIKQYIYLIKKLTNQTINDAMSEEIRKLINEENAELIPLINNELNKICIEFDDLFFKLLEAKINEPIKISENEYIKVETDDDHDGVYIGYKYILSEINSSTIEKAKNYLSELKKCKHEIVCTTDSYFGWYNPVGFKNKKKLENISIKEKVKMIKDKSCLNSFIQEIVEEEKEIRKELIKIIERN